jgi:hypothetical protein
MDKLRLYLALLKIYMDNVQLVHWRVCGNGTHTAHPRYGTYYDALGTFMDETAEQMITLGESPISYPQALELVRDADDIHGILLTGDMQYTESSGDTVVLNMFNQLYDLAESLSRDDSLPTDVQDVFMNHAKWYRIEGKYKIAQNLNGSRTSPVNVVNDEDADDMD